MISSDEYQTPKKYIIAAKEVMGSIDLDAASSEINNLRIKATHYFSKENSALGQSWYADTIWLNPPYSKPNLTLFTNDLIRCHANIINNQIIYLVPSYTSENWYHKCLTYCSAICLPNHRINFLINKKVKDSPRFANTFFYFGNNFSNFVKIFSQFGKCFLNS